MGTAGGAIYLGLAFAWIANDLRRIAGRLGHVPMSGPDAGLGDVPLLVKALEFREEDVRADARRALARIAGEDLGADPAPWREWWDSEGRELRERREAEIAVERLFDTFQGAVMTGQWDRAAGALGFEAREHGSGVDLAGLIRRNRRALRKAWRDAGIEHIEIDGDRAKVEVTWGRHGFESRELAARRVDDEWRFESPPWGHRVVRQRHVVKQTKPARHIRLDAHERRGFSMGGALLFAVVGFWCAAILGSCLFGFAAWSFTSGTAGKVFAVFVFVGALALVLYGVHRRRRAAETTDRRVRSAPATAPGPAAPARSANDEEPERHVPPEHAVSTAERLFASGAFGMLAGAVAFYFSCGERAQIFVALVALAFGSAMTWQVIPILARKRRARPDIARTRAFPLKPEFNLIYPLLTGLFLGFTVLVLLVFCGMRPGMFLGTAVLTGMCAPLLVYLFRLAGQERAYYRALVAGELDGWRKVARKLERPDRFDASGAAIRIVVFLILFFVFGGTILYIAFDGMSMSMPP